METAGEALRRLYRVPTQSPSESSTTKPRAAPQKTPLDLSYEENMALHLEQEDNFLRTLRTGVMVPSIHGLESECVDCRDMGWVRHREPDGSLGTMAYCHCRQQRQAARRIAATVGEDVARRYTFESFRYIPEAGEQHNQVMREACDTAKAWVRGATPPFLVLVGSTGCGKSHLAMAGLQAHAYAGWLAEYRFVPQYLDLLRASYGIEAMREQAEAASKSVMEVPVLVLDDYGLERGTEWAKERMEEIIVWRCFKRMKTFITANTLANATPRVSSRFEDGEHTRLMYLEGAVDVRRYM